MLKRVELAQGLNVKMQESSRLSDIAGCCPIGLWSESPQVSGLRARAHAVSMSCCPIEVSEFKESEAIPDDASYDCEQTGKAMRPPALESDKSKPDIKEQCILAAALRRRCLAQSIQLATSAMVVESTA